MKLKERIKQLEKPMLIFFGAASLTIALTGFEFNYLEATLYDFRMAKGPQRKADSDIVLVTLDDATTRALNEFSPLPVDIHARFLESLESLDPKAVGYLVDMNRVEQMNPELFHTDWGSRFVSAAGRMEARGIPVLLGTPFDVTGEVIPPYPLSSLPHSIARIHKDGNVFGDDKITRRALTTLYDKPVFHLELAQRLGLIAAGTQPRGSFFVPEADGTYFFFRYHGTTALDPLRPEELPYKRVSFLDVLRGTPEASQTIRNKIVLVGTLNKEDSGDYAFTPYSRTAYTNPKLVVHANILDSIIQDDGIVRVVNWINGSVVFLTTTLVIGAVLYFMPLYGLSATLGLSLILVALGQYLFTVHGFWLRVSQPLVGIFLSYYLVVPYRLIREYKKRWDYQKKNEVLIQVEELKTNFLSLVTHDLKTPVARIQGLAEVLMTKAGDRLIERDRETVRHIIDSTDELNRFITSILELTKIDSKGLSLRLESKDINQLIERCVEGFKAQARSLDSSITTQLEPLFPIKIDASLISKVLNNLVDNALKYSQRGSEVLISSREVGDWVEISVKDSGIGMSEEEMRKLFTRFYRAKNDTTTRITGTGLGLYLTRYFVEAHAGRVEVQSVLGEGSTFRILLPIQPPSAAQVPGKPGLVRKWWDAEPEGARQKLKDTVS